MIFLIPHNALIWWRFIKCTFHFDRVCTHKQITYPTKHVRHSKLISIVYINVFVIWEYARNAIESTIIFMMNYFFYWLQKMVFLHLCYKEYTTRIKPLRKLCTHHLSYNFTFCVPFIITILYYLFLNVLIENVKTFVCVRYLYFFAFGMPWLIFVVSIAMSKPRLIIRLFRGHKINLFKSQIYFKLRSICNKCNKYYRIQTTLI